MYVKIQQNKLNKIWHKMTGRLQDVIHYNYLT